MQPKSLSVFQNIAFNPNPIEDYVPMQSLHPMVFDRFCADGWCYWADLLFRRNHWEWRGQPCRVVLLRIDLKHFTLSKSQRKCLRRNADLQMLAAPLHITPKHEDLFEKHAHRFHHNRPMSIYGFFSPWSHLMPCSGAQIEVFRENQLIGVSYFHLGHESMAGNYCIYDPEESARSLGTFTMLLEIQMAKRLGKRYYYPGFVYDLPSEFDYKLNFNSMEYFDWWGNWYPLERLPVRDWREAWTIDPPSF
jgi:arginine-tRNA-protein transferase